MNESTVARSGVTILGSANLDIVFTVDRIPSPGETLLAESAKRYPGGKGLNQAVAAARAGASTCFIGALGSDDAGDLLAATMADAAIDSSRVRRETAPTGQAFIVVDRSGENTIIVASGANSLVTTLAPADAEVLSGSGVLLMQLELPFAVVAEAAATARAFGCVVMLNAAPARTLEDSLLAQLDVLIVNEHEACLVGESDDLTKASAALAARVPRLIVTLGSAGSALYENGLEIARIAAPQVTAVDATGAGDTFCGAFAAAFAEGQGFEPAARFATAAAALSVQVIGAVPSVPMRGRIDAALCDAALCDAALSDAALCDAALCDAQHARRMP
ncbi:ribokinase [Frigoribacterium sp. CG_9.8]|uniref:ribokinase n=1 Tax=Frigoribacterium sp. CG_9.8 TaxID=2787733 RepID=UPI0018CBA4C9|nr:ribokinase [Frigoribacterium sp. CG_9.8]MBG6107730.1 ribokinase [Frigoribacterium sp. CG_9.8]